jgi:hypothetical protein
MPLNDEKLTGSTQKHHGINHEKINPPYAPDAYFWTHGIVLVLIHVMCNPRTYSGLEKFRGRPGKHRLTTFARRLWAMEPDYAGSGIL